jgi:hypothetical protein
MESSGSVLWSQEPASHFILNQINPSTPFHSFLSNPFGIILPTVGLPDELFYFMQFTYLTEFIPLHLVIVLIMNKECKLWCSLLCTFLLPPWSKHLFSVLSGIPSGFFPPLMTDKVSYPLKMTRTTVVALWNILQHTVFHCEVMVASDSFLSNCGRLTLKIHRVVWKNKRLRWSRGTQVRGFKPGRSRRIFQVKKFSARLPSEGK